MKEMSTLGGYEIVDAKAREMIANGDSMFKTATWFGDGGPEIVDAIPYTRPVALNLYGYSNIVTDPNNSFVNPKTMEQGGVLDPSDGRYYVRGELYSYASDPDLYIDFRLPDERGGFLGIMDNTPNEYIQYCDGTCYVDNEGNYWISDEIDFEKGKYYKRVISVKFDGGDDEVITKLNTDSDDWSYVLKLPTHHIDYIAAYCDRLNFVDLFCTSNSEYDVGIRYISGDDFVINIGYYMTDNSVEAIRRTLSEYPLELIYATPTIEYDLPIDVIEEYKKFLVVNPMAWSPFKGFVGAFTSLTYAKSPAAANILDKLSNANNITKVSELENDAGYITEEDLEGLTPGSGPTITKVSQLENDAGYITEEEIGGLIPPANNITKVSELENDAGYITEEYLEGFAPTITKVSELENDAGYIKTDELDEVISERTDTVTTDKHILVNSYEGPLKVNRIGGGLTTQSHTPMVPHPITIKSTVIDEIVTTDHNGGETRVKLSSPIELFNFNNIQDNIYQTHVVKKFRKAIFDGSSDEAWAIESNASPAYNRFVIPVTNCKNIGGRNINLRCNYGVPNGGGNATGCCFTANDKFYIYTNEEVTTLDQWKLKLAANPLVVVYETAIDEITALNDADRTALQSLRTFNEVTCIEFNSPEMPEVNVTYAASELAARVEDVETDIEEVRSYVDSATSSVRYISDESDTNFDWLQVKDASGNWVNAMRAYLSIYELYVDQNNGGEFIAFAGKTNSNSIYTCKVPELTYANELTITLPAPMNGVYGVGCAITKAIDLSRFKRLKFVFSGRGGGSGSASGETYANLIITQNKAEVMTPIVTEQLYNYYSNNNVTNKEVEIDISALSGEYYIAIEIYAYSGNNSTVIIDNMYME